MYWIIIELFWNSEILLNYFWMTDLIPNFSTKTLDIMLTDIWYDVVHTVDFMISVNKRTSKVERTSDFKNIMTPVEEGYNVGFARWLITTYALFSFIIIRFIIRFTYKGLSQNYCQPKKWPIFSQQKYSKISNSVFR